MKKKQHINAQLYLGFFLAIFGVVLIIVSFIVPPMGVIDASVLAAIGEVFTFSGALIGVDYHYKYKTISYINHKNDKEDDKEQETDQSL